MATIGVSAGVDETPTMASGKRSGRKTGRDSRFGGNLWLAIRTNRKASVGLGIGSFSPFTLVMVLINPLRYATDAFANPDDWIWNRGVTFVCGWLAVAAYAGIVYAMYKSMVKNFDMTIRKQSDGSLLLTGRYTVNPKQITGPEIDDAVSSYDPTVPPWDITLKFPPGMPAPPNH